MHACIQPALVPLLHQIHFTLFIQTEVSKESFFMRSEFSLHISQTFLQKLQLDKLLNFNTGYFISQNVLHLLSFPFPWTFSYLSSLKTRQNNSETVLISPRLLTFIHWSMLVFRNNWPLNDYLSLYHIYFSISSVHQVLEVCVSLTVLRSTDDVQSSFLDSLSWYFMSTFFWPVIMSDRTGR